MVRRQDCRFFIANFNLVWQYAQVKSHLAKGFELHNQGSGFIAT